jgi:hypothetical protein
MEPVNHQQQQQQEGGEARSVASPAGRSINLDPARSRSRHQPTLTPQVVVSIAPAMAGLLELELKMLDPDLALRRCRSGPVLGHRFKARREKGVPWLSNSFF